VTTEMQLYQLLGTLFIPQSSFTEHP